MTRIVDPTDERVPLSRTLAPRPQRLSGVVALLDIVKPRGDVFWRVLPMATYGPEGSPRLAWRNRSAF